MKKEIWKNCKKLVDKGKTLWYSNIAVGESSALKSFKVLEKINFQENEKSS